MGRDARRTLLIVGEDVDLFAAVRPELDPAMIQVTWSRPGELEAALEGCVPWPWAVAGSGSALPAACVAALRGLPVLWFWLGEAPASVPRDVRAHGRWRELLADVRDCLARTLGGVRLAPNRGLVGPAQDLVLSAELEGLFAAAPAPMRLSSRVARAAVRAVDRHRLPLTLVRSADSIHVEGAG
ncbi:MAG TPA: hypothetical protein VIN56_06950 [Candidatus Dormibacteraeota bacterium]|jgi:hypothetical protein